MAVSVDHVHLFIKNVSQKWFVVHQKYSVSGIAKRGRQNWQCYAKCMHFSQFYKCIIYLESWSRDSLDPKALELIN
jgi:hypothetical protein